MTTVTTPVKSDFMTGLAAAVGVPGVPLVLVGNFEVEQQWARGECGLPRVSADAGTAVVNHMDQFALLLAGPGDHVVLKAAPDREYLAYLAGLGIEVPTMHIVRDGEPTSTVTEDALGDVGVLRSLAALGPKGAVLLPHGVSEVEEQLAAATGLALAAPSAAVCRSVNSKVYSRRLADELGIRQADGWACATLAELDAAVAAATELLDAGAKVVVKEALGVSGKGIAVVDSARRLARLRRMIHQRAERMGTDRIGFVIERWVTKRADLNYQCTVGRDGSVRFDFVKEAITRGGVHKGHRMPAALTVEQTDVLRRTADLLGARLAADGYHGVVGIDALLMPDGSVYPMIEINARNNMSTYQVRLQERFVPPDGVALAKHYPLRLHRPMPFYQVRELLAGLLVARPGGNGLLINNFATVNAAAATGSPFDGRLYGLVVAESTARLAALDDEIGRRLGISEED
ncbi:MAG TPA: hypothetical protein VH352_22505 [Pseudonocardiaceae bacterium]|jgi:hypothetical protein|nr:hypothetical protein [Pseudonocardiaceae bacterium]